MTDSNLPAGNTKLLSGLLSLADDSPQAAKSAGWSPAELAAVWRHQLKAPLLVDLGDVAPDAAMTVAQVTQPQRGSLESFADLVGHPDPPAELLQLAKEFAKSQRAGAAGTAFPAEVATALYYLSIALPLARTGRRITEMDDAKLRQGLEWGLRQPWLDEATRNLYRDALRRLPGAPD